MQETTVGSSNSANSSVFKRLKTRSCRVSRNSRSVWPCNIVCIVSSRHRSSRLVVRLRMLKAIWRHSWHTHTRKKKESKINNAYPLNLLSSLGRWRRARNWQGTGTRGPAPVGTPIVCLFSLESRSELPVRSLKVLLGMVFVVSRWISVCCLIHHSSFICRVFCLLLSRWPPTVTLTSSSFSDQQQSKNTGRTLSRRP